MPIVGGTALLGTTPLGSTTYTSTIRGLVTHDASKHSHRTIFATSTADESSSTDLDVPQLTAYCTLSTECAEGWMLAGSQLVATTRIIPTVQVDSSPGDTSSIIIVATAGAVPLVVASLVLDQPTFETTSPVTTPLAELLPQEVFVVHTYTADSLDPKETAVGTMTLATSSAASTWQKEDLGSLPSDWTASLAKKIGVVLPANTDGTSRQDGAGVSGLSAGTKAGIGVGAAIGALIVVMAIVLLCLRRRRKTKCQQAMQDYTMPEDGKSGSRPRQEEMVDWREVEERGQRPT